MHFKNKERLALVALALSITDMLVYMMRIQWTLYEKFCLVLIRHGFHAAHTGLWVVQSCSQPRVRIRQ